MLHFRKYKPEDDAGEIIECGRIRHGEDGLIMLAFDDGELAGACSMEIDAGKAWINSLFIIEDKRHQGIGTGLVKSTLFAAYNKGVETVKAIAPKTITGYFEHLGFRRQEDGNNVLQVQLDGYFKCCNND